MILISDTRQQKGKHDNIEQYCKANGIEIYPKCLQVGDYMLGGIINNRVEIIGNISVDTKQDLVELANDLVNDRQALNKKYKKCFKQNIKLYVLIEETGYKSLLDVKNWVNPYTKDKKIKMTGKKLMNEMFRLEVSYGIKFVFCDKKYTGKALISILSSGKYE